MLISSRYELRRFVRSFGVGPTVKQRLEILKNRQAHKKLRDIFIRSAEEHLGEELVTLILESQTLPLDDPELTSENNGIGPVRSIAEIENQRFPFPSYLQMKEPPNTPSAQNATVQRLRQMELELRIGHAEDCLEAIRGALIQVSWVFKNKVRAPKAPIAPDPMTECMH